MPSDREKAQPQQGELWAHPLSRNTYRGVQARGVRAMTQEELEALANLIRYNWDDEERDYNEQPSETHIYLDLVTLQGLLEKESGL